MCGVFFVIKIFRILSPETSPQSAGIDYCTLQWRHNEIYGILTHRRLVCFLNRLFRCRSQKTSKLCVNGLCEGNLPVTGEFPAQRASNAENVFIWWRHHETSSSEPGDLNTIWRNNALTAVEGLETQTLSLEIYTTHGDVIKLTHFPCY